MSARRSPSSSEATANPVDEGYVELSAEFRRSYCFDAAKPNRPAFVLGAFGGVVRTAYDVQTCVGSHDEGSEILRLPARLVEMAGEDQFESLLPGAARARSTP